MFKLLQVVQVCSFISAYNVLSSLVFVNLGLLLFLFWGLGGLNPCPYIFVFMYLVVHSLLFFRWSLGAIMYEMLVGYPPFYSDDPMSTCRKVSFRVLPLTIIIELA